jgi:hypothetical protein
MDADEIQKLKLELMQPGWTEDLHDELNKLRPEDAKQIVESMTDFEIYQKVNNRRHQEDYIDCYITYLWDISETAFWRHVKISIDDHHGILWGDDMSNFERMCNVKLPKDVLIAFLGFAIKGKKKSPQDIEAVGCVIKAQVKKFERYLEVKEYISLLKESEQASANKLVNTMINGKCNYSFYYR